MKKLISLFVVSLFSSLLLFAQVDAGDAAYVSSWTFPIAFWFDGGFPSDDVASAAKNQAVSYYVSSFNAATADFDIEWAKIPGDGSTFEGFVNNPGSNQGAADFGGAAIKSFCDDNNMYIMLQYTDDDITGTEEVQINFAPYLKVNAPDVSRPGAWYIRYSDFGAYSLSFSSKGFLGAMVVEGGNGTGNLSFYLTPTILTNSISYNNKTVDGSHVIKEIFTIGYGALTGAARPNFDRDIWYALNSKKGISFDINVKDADSDDPIDVDQNFILKSAGYWWNSQSNECWQSTSYAGFLSTNSAGINTTFFMHTNPVTTITLSTAVFNAYLDLISSTAVTAHGFCWNTTGSPTIADNKIDNGAKTTIGAFSNSISSLVSGTKYYIKAFATNGVGTIYGNEVSFTTASIPAFAGTISGLQTVCQGQSAVTYTVPVVSNATSYIWTLPTGINGTSSTNSISVNYAKTFISGNISVKGHN